MIPLVAPCYDDADRRAVHRAVEDEGFSEGPLVRELEHALSSRLGLRGGVATTSGTTALHLALATLGVGPGDEVITPSYTCVAVAHAITTTGARPVLVDIARSPAKLQYNVDPDRVAAAVTPRTAAIVVPHAFGVALDVRALPPGIPVIEDIAMTLGARLPDDTPAGASGACTTVSLHSSKVISAGQGGVALFRTDELLARARARNDDTGSQASDRVRELGLMRSTYELKTGYRMTDTAAALGVAQLSKLDAFISRRRTIASAYDHALEGLATVPADIDRGSFPFRYQIDVGARDPREVIDALAARGVEAGRGVYPPLHTLFGQGGWEASNTMHAVRSAVSLPVHPALSDADVEHVSEAAQEVLRS